ncbi:hypothetical protein HZD82_22450 [Pantoea agglomerans]|uniref:hypothetical protein n=1 Tax=Enterobacter agglomerans TaxID=549 RepID=UPI001A8E04DC|nr:hypothetical protein [Pantoea agglomerans]MBN9931318.1 hypothetical protein [Pantoea agglomerans]
MAQVTKKEVDVVVCGLGWAGSLMSIELALAGLDHDVHIRYLKQDYHGTGY